MEKLVMNVVHYPSLKTILAIEDVIRDADMALSRNQILAKLPTKVMHSTLNLALAYMEKRGLVLETSNGFIWTFNPNKRLEKVEMEATAMRNDIDKIRRNAVPILKAGGVKRAAVFGSVARGEAKATSDVDFLIEFKKKRPTLFDIGGLKGDLEEKLKRSVDLILFRSIDPRLRDRILRERVDIL